MRSLCSCGVNHTRVHTRTHAHIHPHLLVFVRLGLVRAVLSRKLRVLLFLLALGFGGRRGLLLLDLRVSCVGYARIMCVSDVRIRMANPKKSSGHTFFWVRSLAVIIV